MTELSNIVKTNPPSSSSEGMNVLRQLPGSRLNVERSTVIERLWNTALLDVIYYGVYVVHTFLMTSRIVDFFPFLGSKRQVNPRSES